MLDFKRADSGLEAIYINLVVGRKARCDIAKDTPIDIGMLE